MAWDNIWKIHMKSSDHISTDANFYCEEIIDLHNLCSENMQVADSSEFV